MQYSSKRCRKTDPLGSCSDEHMFLKSHADRLTFSNNMGQYAFVRFLKHVFIAAAAAKRIRFSAMLTLLHDVKSAVALEFPISP